jgi:hypothetical protein
MFGLGIELEPLPLAKNRELKKRAASLSSFKIRTIAMIVFQFRVVAGSPYSLLIRPI